MNAAKEAYLVVIEDSKEDLTSSGILYKNAGFVHKKKRGIQKTDIFVLGTNNQFMNSPKTNLQTTIMKYKRNFQIVEIYEVNVTNYLL